MDPSEERLIESNPDDIYGNQDTILEVNNVFSFILNQLALNC